MPDLSNVTSHSLLELLNKKIDDLIVSLPNTYVTIRSHEIQIKSHDEKIVDLMHRLSILESWRSESTAWANDQHMEMRREWTKEVKEVNTALDSVQDIVIKLSEHVNLLIKVLLWLLGLLSSVIVALIIAWITHIIK